MEIQKIIYSKIDERFNLIENKLRNSFSAVKANDEDVKKKLEELSNVIKNSTFSKDIADLNKKVQTNNESFSKFKKEMARDSLKREVVKEVMPLFNEKIDVGLKLVKLENKEMRKDFSDFKKKWENATEAKLNAGLEEMRANFASLDKKAVSEMRTLKSSTKRAISDQNGLIDQYSAKLENYSAELETEYAKSKKEISSSVERKIRDYKNASDAEVAKLTGQMAYLKGRVNSTLGKEEPVKQEKVAKKSFLKGFFAKKEKKDVSIVVEKKEDVKKAKLALKKNNTLFSNLVSLLADESPEMKVEFTPAKKVAKDVAKTVAIKSTKPVKKLEKQEESGFFNSIIKSLAD